MKIYQRVTSHFRNILDTVPQLCEAECGFSSTSHPKLRSSVIMCRTPPFICLDWQKKSGKEEIANLLFQRGQGTKTLWVVGGLEQFLFFHILGIVTPTDELHHFSEG